MADKAAETAAERDERINAYCAERASTLLATAGFAGIVVKNQAGNCGKPWKLRTDREKLAYAREIGPGWANAGVKRDAALFAIFVGVMVLEADSLTAIDDKRCMIADREAIIEKLMGGKELAALIESEEEELAGRFPQEGVYCQGTEMEPPVKMGSAWKDAFSDEEMEEALTAQQRFQREMMDVRRRYELEGMDIGAMEVEPLTYSDSGKPLLERGPLYIIPEGHAVRVVPVPGAGEVTIRDMTEADMAELYKGEQPEVTLRVKCGDMTEEMSTLKNTEQGSMLRHMQARLAVLEAGATGETTVRKLMELRKREKALREKDEIVLRTEVAEFPQRYPHIGRYCHIDEGGGDWSVRDKDKEKKILDFGADIHRKKMDQMREAREAEFAANREEMAKIQTVIKKEMAAEEQVQRMSDAQDRVREMQAMEDREAQRSGVLPGGARSLGDMSVAEVKDLLKKTKGRAERDELRDRIIEKNMAEMDKKI